MLILCACVITTLIPEADTPNEPQYLILIPLTLLGIGYSFYFVALSSSIPYTVPTRLVGTAYGICTAVVNIGLTISPWVSA